MACVYIQTVKYVFSEIYHLKFLLTSLILYRLNIKKKYGSKGQKILWNTYVKSLLRKRYNISAVRRYAAIT